MTTITLLYLAIYEYLKNNNPDKKNIDSLVKLQSLRNRLYLNESIIEDLTELNKPKFLGLRRLSKAFNYFRDRLNQCDENGKPLYGYSEVQSFLTKLNSATLVKIDVATHADAFTLFETLNNRGVPLSAIDLIKNKLLGQLEKEDVAASLRLN